ncbi:MAG: C25 family cysteine peptidase [Bacteroidota bacterium]|nr:C25 family cysteine peptidase [Bacteroidota bacterium]
MNKKFLYILVFFLSLYRFAFSQPIGNEWINYNQQYFKITISKEGVYRIYYNTLNGPGLQLNNIDPRSIQIFTNGHEIPIYISGENDGVFNKNDYIEFYAKNDNGWFDSLIYTNPKYQANTNLNLYNNTSTYFITYNSSVNNKRFKPENDISFSSYTPIQYFIKESRQDYFVRYYDGQTNSYGATDPEFTAGEGWFDYDFGSVSGGSTSYGSSVTKNISTSNAFIGGPNADIQTVVIGASDYAAISGNNHHLQIKIGNTILKDTAYHGYCINRFNLKLPAIQLGSLQTNVTFSSISDLGSGADRNALSYISIKYPHTYDFENQSSYMMYIPNSDKYSKSLINIKNFNTSIGDSAVIYDLTNNKRIKVIKQGNGYSALIPNSDGLKKCYLVAENMIDTINTVIPVNSELSNYAKFYNFTSPDNLNNNYIIISHKNLWSAAKEYSDYRKSTGLSPILVDIDDLYDQFSYGIVKHPLAIRNFCRFAVANFTLKIEGLFLIGKSIILSQGASHVQNLIPTFGNPPSDIMLTAGIREPLYTPDIPVGRLAALTQDDVILYLNKVRQYEEAQKTPAEWMKNVLHFGGGNTPYEQAMLAGYLNNFKKTIEDTLFGGTVTSFFKTSSAPIEPIKSDLLTNLINNGVSIMTFFAHAGGTVFDESTDVPSHYNNSGKYPFLLANSCYAGDIHEIVASGKVRSSSEEFVLIPDKGAIAFLASITISNASPLNTFSDNFYKNISSYNYGKSIGSSIQKTIRNIQNNFNDAQNTSLKWTCLEMTLHGDPVLKLNVFDKPDYVINQKDISFNPGFVTTDIDSFSVCYTVTNIGKAIDDSIFVQIIRTPPSPGSALSYLMKIPAPKYKSSFCIKLPTIKNSEGQNSIKIIVDFYNQVSEMNKLNNSAEINFFVTSSDIIPVYPYNYAIIPNNSVTLKASTGNPLAKSREYEFQIDSTATYNSPVFHSAKISQSGGIVTWTPPITFVDSAVYFWRVRANGSNNWRGYSFQYIKGKNGWGQSKFDQFKNDSYLYINYDSLHKKLEFVDNYSQINVQTGIYPYIQWIQEWFKLNGGTLAYSSCITGGYYNGNKGGIIVAVFDPVTFQPWASYQNNSIGNLMCDTKLYRFEFLTNSSNIQNRKNFNNFINSIPCGYYVLMYTACNPAIPTDSSIVSLYKSFESIGAIQSRTIADNRAYIVFGQKCAPAGSAEEHISVTPSDILKLDKQVVTKWNEGRVVSELVGPATHWGSLHWRKYSLESKTKDFAGLYILGVKKTGQIDTIKSNILPDNGDILNLETYADAKVYPYLQLYARLKDDSLHTAPQLKRWQVLYDGIPETALDANINYSFHKDTIQEGDNVRLTIATHNISNYNMDSLLVSAWIVDQSRNIHKIQFKHLRPHPAGDILIDTIIYNSKGLQGNNILWLEVNPDNEQNEQYHFNNIAQIPFYVLKDKTNPILDVTFDGIHILNRDIISPKPSIEIKLKDENKYLALNDTSAFKIKLINPAGESKRIYFGNNPDILRFFPAVLPDNTCKIEYHPSFTEDGLYHFNIEAQDISSNQSGIEPYSVSFNVINKSSISEVLNWPNPFSTSTRFVFMLTGSDAIPSTFKIQIMTITGKVVKEITQEEIGPLHIGRNITDYAWDGKDEYGNQLANGIYLYKVVAKFNGNKIDKYNTGEDLERYFRNGLGKMYLMR